MIMRVDCMPLERRNSLILFKVFILRKEFNQELFSFSMKLFLNLYKPTILEIKSDLHDDIPITFLSFFERKKTWIVLPRIHAKKILLITQL
ncbi:hypothetical protein P245_27800 [Comamonas thiooxydans]|uniref:Uncharacterized protein n=1 Tax=Comamonas thiooxydans TaxID=363952 RepID=A0A0E3B6G5_9BURK|nr:hypothetical protein P245_27800 [Comamonas thiooxydans]